MVAHSFSCLDNSIHCSSCDNVQLRCVCAFEYNMFVVGVFACGIACM